MTPKPKSPLKAPGKPNPEDDGKTHINIYDQGKSELGRMLSYFYEAPFQHPHYGPFKSIEGFLRYLRSGGEDDAFRTIPAVRAKAHAESAKRRGEYKDHQVRDLDKIIFAANYAKIDQNPEIKKALINSTLPFENYFLWNTSGVVIRPKGSKFVIRDFPILRQMFIDGGKPEPIDYAKITFD